MGTHADEEEPNPEDDARRAVYCAQLMRGEAEDRARIAAVKAELHSALFPPLPFLK